MSPGNIKSVASQLRTVPTMDAVLSDKTESPYSLREFQNFLKKSHCYENYDFIVQLDDFLAHPEDQTRSTGDTIRRLQWVNIVKFYVEVCAEFEINLTGELRHKLLGNYDSVNNDYSDEQALQRLQIPCVEVLFEAKDETYLLLQDAYMQFLKSVANGDDNSLFIDKHNTMVSSNIDEEVVISGNYCLTTPMPKHGRKSKPATTPQHLSITSINSTNRCSSPLSETNSHSTASRVNSMDLDLPGLDDYLNSVADNTKNMTKTTNSTATTISANDDHHTNHKLYESIVTDTTPNVTPRQFNDKSKSKSSHHEKESSPKHHRDFNWKKMGRKLKLF